MDTFCIFIYLFSYLQHENWIVHPVIFFIIQVCTAWWIWRIGLEWVLLLINLCYSYSKWKWKITAQQHKTTIFMVNHPL